MSDLFHRDVPTTTSPGVFAVMALAQHHTFQVLTKRHGRMRSLLCDETWRARVAAELDRITPPILDRWPLAGAVLPLPNAWIGVSAEDHKRATLRVPALAETPAAIRFVSAEPLLGPLGPVDLDAVDWCIIGGESGPHARPMDPGWVRDLIAACRDAGTAVFVKQLGTAWATIPRPGRQGHSVGELARRPEDPRVPAHPERARTGPGAVAVDHVPGTIYLLHFDQPYKHARHYLGWASDLDARLAQHAAGTGARLLQVARDAGIGWQLARTWPGDRYRERQLKNQGGRSRMCPVCKHNTPKETAVDSQSSTPDGRHGQQDDRRPALRAPRRPDLGPPGTVSRPHGPRRLGHDRPVRRRRAARLRFSELGTLSVSPFSSDLSGDCRRDSEVGCGGSCGG